MVSVNWGPLAEAAAQGEAAQLGAGPSGDQQSRDQVVDRGAGMDLFGRVTLGQQQGAQAFAAPSRLAVGAPGCGEACPLRPRGRRLVPQRYRWPGNDSLA